MPGLVRKSLDSPEETRPFEGNSGQLELVNVESGAVGRATFLPGWRWSEHIKPIAQTDSCEAAHMGYFISGRMKVVMDDGEEMEFGPGDFDSLLAGAKLHQFQRKLQLLHSLNLREVLAFCQLNFLLSG